MLSGMKPLPKAIIIALPIMIAVALYVKFAPEKMQTVVSPAPIVLQQVEPTSIQPPEAVIQSQMASEPEQSEGMKALLQKGKK